MEIYYQPVQKWFATPDGVGIVDAKHSIRLNWDDDDANAFVYLNNGEVIIGEPSIDHETLKQNNNVNLSSIALEGRYWYFDKILTFWNFRGYNQAHLPSSVELKSFIDAVEKDGGCNLSNYKLCIEHSGLDSAIIVIIQVMEYIQMGLSGKEDGDWWYTHWERQEKLKSLTKRDIRTTTNGMDAKDVWRHYTNVGESKKIQITPSDIEFLVNECVMCILSESVYMDAQKINKNKKDYLSKGDYLKYI